MNELEARRMRVQDELEDIKEWEEDEPEVQNVPEKNDADYEAIAAALAGYATSLNNRLDDLERVVEELIGQRSNLEKLQKIAYNALIVVSIIVLIRG